jgi:O-antigen ligase
MQKYLIEPTRIDLLAKVFLIIGVFFVPISTSLMTIGLSLAVVLVLLSGQWQAKWDFLKERPALWLPLILVALILLSTLHGVIPWSERLTMAKKYHQLLAIPFLAWLFITESTRTKALIAFVSVISLIWVLCYGLFYFNISVVNKGNETVFHDHISIGIMSAFTVFIFLYLFQVSKGYQKYAYLFMALFGSWYMLFINSGRSAYFVFFALIVLFAWRFWRWKGIIASFLLVGVLVGTLFFFSSIFHSVTVIAAKDSTEYLSGQKQADRSYYGSASLRMITIKAASHLLKEHPIVGVGTGSYFQAASELPWVTAKTNMALVSNELLNMGVQTGLLGILLIFFVQWRESLTLPPLYSHIAQMLIGTMIVTGIINTPLVDAIPANFYSVFVALCFASSAKSVKAKIT